jgi:hypothetical protein
MIMAPHAWLHRYTNHNPAVKNYNKLQRVRFWMYYYVNNRSYIKVAIRKSAGRLASHGTMVFTQAIRGQMLNFTKMQNVGLICYKFHTNRRALLSAHKSNVRRRA